MARRHGWTDEQIKNLPDFKNRDDFSPAVKAALELAERATRDPHEVDDEFWSELRRHYDEGEIIELLAAIGLFNYFKPCGWSQQSSTPRITASSSAVLRG